MINQTSVASKDSIPSQFLKVLHLKVGIISLLLLCLLCVALHASWERPIWIDEFLHFALGSHRTTSEAWDTISQSVTTVNHGQTGIYMLLDYWLLQFFGASRFWLRFPSILSAIILFGASVYLFHLWRMSFLWKVIGVLSLFSQGTLMFYVGEARPYMPLVAATVGTLAYYTIPTCNKRDSILLRALGLSFILFGVLFHPYFSIYWLTICIFTFVQKWIEEDKFKLSISSFIYHADVPIFILGFTTYFILGFATWLKGKPDFSFDPFEWLKNDSLSNVFFDLSHMQFLRGAVYPFLTLVLSMMLLIVFLPRLRATSLRLLISPTILLAFTFSISIFLSYVSFLQKYWILPRQWVASMALSALACVLFAHVIFKVLANFHIFVAIIWFGLFSTPILANAQQTFNTNLPQLIQATIPVRLNYPNPLISEYQLQFPKNNDEWVSLANENIRQKGAVWSIFRAYYSKDTSGLWKRE
ncbi:MAG TPA: hypothetical protein V6C78_04255 [Crinalium sp.]|jgi:hypothetical protein